MKYKKSRYIHIVETAESFLMLNTLNGNAIKTIKKTGEEFKKCFDNPNIYTNDSIKEYLFDKGFIVEDTKNELSLANELYTDYRTNNQNVMHLIILPTEDCNFRCWYCYEESNIGKMTKSTAESIVKYVEANIDKYQSLYVGWFGGEPLEGLDIIKYLSEAFISICNEKEISYFAHMTTNGYDLTKEVFQQLLHYKVYDYQITVDGIKEDHDAQRVHMNSKGTYDVIVNNLLNIRDEITDDSFRITIRTNITKNNLTNIDRHIDFLSNEFRDDHRFGIIMKIAWDCNNKKECFKSDQILPQNYLHCVLNKCKGKKLRFLYNYQQYSPFGHVCYASSKHSLVIGANGNIYKCTIHMTDDKKIGVLNKDGTIELNQKAFNTWTEKIFDSVQYKKCDNCKFYPMCFGISCPNNNGVNKLICPPIKEYIDDFMILFAEQEDTYEIYDNEID